MMARLARRAGDFSVGFLLVFTCLGIAVVGLAGWAACWVVAHVRIGVV